MNTDPTESVDTLVKLILEEGHFLGHYLVEKGKEKHWVLGKRDRRGVLETKATVPSDLLVPVLLRLIQRYLETRFGDASEG